MFGYLLRFLLILSVMLIFQRCAQMSPLTGGERDRQPPQLLSATPALNSTSFHSAKILLIFNEYLKLGDLQSNLLVLPRIANNPEVEVDGRRVIIRLDTNDLRKNTSYRIHFGDAICDLNEGNPARNFEYVFSTGPYIDSLRLEGQVKDALDNSPIDNVLIALYQGPDLSDSIVYNGRPDYITRSLKGQFRFSHLPAGTFRAFAIEDLNKNLNYDPDAERIGFLDQDLNLPSDTAMLFSLFKEVPYKVFIKKSESPYYGHARVILNKAAPVHIKTLDPEQAQHLFVQHNDGLQDTILIYYKEMEDSLKLLLRLEEKNRTDTLQIRLPKRSTRKKGFAYIQLNTPNQKLPRKQALKMRFINWMDTSAVDLKRIHFRVKQDTFWAEQPVQVKWSSLRELQLADSLPEGLNYELKLDTGALRDIFLSKNDSVVFRFSSESLAELGKAVLNLQFYRKDQYLVQFLNTEGNIQRSEAISLSLSSSNVTRLEFQALPPGAYRVRVVSDRNKNGKWDSGSLSKKQQAEPVYIHPRSITVLPDWEIEEEIKVKD